MLMSSSERAATLFYQPAGYRVVSPGTHITCAVSGEAVPLEALRYWCAVRQEGYASAAVATRRMLEKA